MNDSNYSLADIAAATGNGNGGWGGFGGEGGWGIIWLVVLAFLFLGGGWGNGWGNNGGGSGAQPNYVLTSDMASLERKLDLVQAQSCDNFAAIQSTLSNNFAANMTSMHDGFSSAELSRSTQQAALMSQMYNQNMTAMQNACDASRQVAEGFNTTNYNMATNTSALQTSLANSTRDIMANADANARAIHDELVAQRIEAKDAKIAELTQQLNNAQLRASQAAQTNQIQDYVGDQFAMYNPRPVPSFNVAAPFQYTGCSNGCGCNM